MGIGDASGSQRFPVDAETAWRHLRVVAGNIGKVKSVDDFLKRVTISTGMGLFTSGENVSVSISPVSDAACEILVESSQKISTQVLGASRSKKTIDRIISELSASLQRARR